MGSIIFVSQKSDLQTLNRDSWQHAEECYHKSATEGTSCQFAAILSGCGKSGRRLQEQTAHNRLYQLDSMAAHLNPVPTVTGLTGPALPYLSRCGGFCRDVAQLDLGTLSPLL